jgi:hypothetical protein
MEVLKRCGYITVLTFEDGKPRLIWAAFIKRGIYGPYISVEKCWVQSHTKKGQAKELKWAGKSYNFPLDTEKAEQHLKDLATLVHAALRSSKEFSTAQTDLQNGEDLGMCGPRDAEAEDARNLDEVFEK